MGRSRKSMVTVSPLQILIWLLICADIGPSLGEEGAQVAYNYWTPLNSILSHAPIYRDARAQRAGFWAARGKRSGDIADDDDFFAFRGKKNNLEDNSDFWAYRGKKDLLEEKRNDFWAQRGKREDEDGFWAQRGKKDEDDGFWAQRGKRATKDIGDNMTKKMMMMDFG